LIGRGLAAGPSRRGRALGAEFDPDDDLALEGQRDEEEGEDEEGEEDGGGVEALDDGEAGPSEGSATPPLLVATPPV